MCILVCVYGVFPFSEQMLPWQSIFSFRSGCFNNRCFCLWLLFTAKLSDCCSAYVLFHIILLTHFFICTAISFSLFHYWKLQFECQTFFFFVLSLHLFCDMSVVVVFCLKINKKYVYIFLIVLQYYCYNVRLLMFFFIVFFSSTNY